MNNKNLLKKVKNCIQKLEPKAEILLYGSRSQGTYNKNSDWDFLILINGKVNHKRIDKIRHKIYEVEWESGEVISSIIKSKDDWLSPKYKVTPFYQNVTKHGIHI